jgi:hypothetical protein
LWDYWNHTGDSRKTRREREREREREGETGERAKETWTMIFETKVGEMKHSSQFTNRTQLVVVYGRVPRTDGCRGKY